MFHRGHSLLHALLLYNVNVNKYIYIQSAVATRKEVMTATDLCDLASRRRVASLNGNDVPLLFQPPVCGI